MKRMILVTVVLVMWASIAWADCKVVFVCDDKGVCTNLMVCS